ELESGDAMRECYSPELNSMNRDSSSFRNSGTYTSPGTPDYADNNGRGFQKGWCSERVPLSNNGKIRRTSVNVLMPFNNGRTLPSKWDDAERWITSPVSGSGSGVSIKNLGAPPQRRPKSKSGPLGPTPGDGYFSGYSPGFPLLEGGSANNLFARSPLTTGVLVPSGYTFGNGDGDDGDSVLPSGYTFGNGDGDDGDSVRAHIEYRVATSQLFLESPYPDSEDEKIDENNVTYDVSRRDMATQMSPVESPESSPKGRAVLPASPLLIASAMDHRSHHSAGVEVRDVQVDKRVTMSKQPKRHAWRMERNRSTEIKELSLTWNPTEEAMESSKYVSNSSL
nr:hypothetical protein [Tanacetum cinerariifolium]